MASDLQGQFSAASNINFQQRVSAALAVVAVQVYVEDPATPGHAVRKTYSLEVIKNPPLSMISTNQFGTATPDLLVYAWSRLLATQGLDNSATDAQIQTQVANDWNAMAGV